MELNKEQKEFLATHFDARRYENIHLYETDQDYGMMYCIDLPDELFEGFDEWNSDPIYDYFKEVVQKTDQFLVGLMIVDTGRLLFDLFDRDGGRITEDGAYVQKALMAAAFKCGDKHKGITIDTICASEYESALWETMYSVWLTAYISVGYDEVRKIVPYDEWRTEFLRAYHRLDDDLPF